MDTGTVTLQLPARLYADLQFLAETENSDPIEIISRLVAHVRQQRAWRRDLVALREQIRQEGDLQVGVTKDEVVKRLRQTRQELFETEYAHLYR